MENKTFKSLIELFASLIISIGVIGIIASKTKPIKAPTEDPVTYSDEDGRHLNLKLIDEIDSEIKLTQTDAECTGIISIGKDNKDTFIAVEIAANTPLVGVVTIKTDEINLENTLIEFLDKYNSNNAILSNYEVSVKYYKEIAASNDFKEAMKDTYYKDYDFKFIYGEDLINSNTKYAFASWKNIPSSGCVSYISYDTNLDKSKENLIVATGQTLTNYFLENI